jgi:UPF0755 protein
VFKLIGAVMLVAVLGAVVVLASVFSPFQGFKDEVFIDFPKGTSTRAMATQLAAAGVIRYPWQFLVARAIHPGSRLQAGEYRFAQPASVAGIFSRLARGDIYYHEFTVPEGTNIFDLSNIVAGTGIIQAADFLKAAGDPGMIRDLAPKATSLEGYLFPSTYRITRRTTAAQLCKLMTDQFRKEWKPLADSSKLNAHQAVTLASLVEKETGVKTERPLVASVFQNRLRKGMMLGCDPTTIYAALIENRYRGKIYQSDLASENPYNTYRHFGLPPGPIANPGLASLEAAVAPAETDFLYFVAKPGGVGSHNFSSSSAGHERAVAEYRRGVKAVQ